MNFLICLVTQTFSRVCLLDLCTLPHKSIGLSISLALTFSSTLLSNKVSSEPKKYIYSPFDIWKKRWGWEYEEARETFPLKKYKGTLLEQFYDNDLKKGPLKNIKINE